MFAKICLYLPVVATAANATLNYFGLGIFGPAVDELFRVLCLPAAAGLHLVESPIEK